MCRIRAGSGSILTSEREVVAGTPLERSLLKVKAVECVSREWYAMAASIEYHLRIGTNELGYRFS